MKGILAIKGLPERYVFQVGGAGEGRQRRGGQEAGGARVCGAGRSIQPAADHGPVPSLPAPRAEPPRPSTRQAVHMLFEGTPERPWREGEPRTSRMVFIGRELDRETFLEVRRRGGRTEHRRAASGAPGGLLLAPCVEPALRPPPSHTPTHPLAVSAPRYSTTAALTWRRCPPACLMRSATAWRPAPAPARATREAARPRQLHPWA
jgi:hypothetical protein